MTLDVKLYYRFAAILSTLNVLQAEAAERQERQRKKL